MEKFPSFYCSSHISYLLPSTWNKNLVHFSTPKSTGSLPLWCSRSGFKSFRLTLFFPQFCYAVWNVKLANDCKPEIQPGTKMRISTNLLHWTHIFPRRLTIASSLFGYSLLLTNNNCYLTHDKKQMICSTFFSHWNVLCPTAWACLLADSQIRWMASYRPLIFKDNFLKKFKVGSANQLFGKTTHSH